MTAAPQRSPAPERETVQAAEREIERDYAQLEAEVVGTARAKLDQTGGTIDEQALAAAYNQAWHALYTERVAGTEIANRVGFLVQVTYRRALDERRAAARRTATDPTALEVGVDPDLDARLDDALRVRALMQGMRERLDGRELRAAALCYLHGYTRPEAAAALGVRPRRFEKVMDRVSREMSGLVGDLRGDEWCDSRRSLIGAYALGVLDVEGERYRLAADHLEDCAACRRRVLCMRGLAGVAPPVAALVPGATGGAGGGASSALADRLGWLGRFEGHGLEVAAGGAVVAVATGAFVVAGPPSDRPDREPSSAAATAPLRSSASQALSAAAVRGAARARAAAAARQRAEERRRASARGATPSGAALPEPAVSETVAPAQPSAPPEPAPAPAAPPSSAPAGPADDGWEEFELRR